MLHGRLLVLDHLGTTFAQALAANVPTILFWRKELCRLTSDAAPLVEGLAAAGMLFHSPEDAARHAAAVWNDVADWWNGRELCQARKAFASRFAFTSDEAILGRWWSTLTKI